MLLSKEIIWNEQFRSRNLCFALKWIGARIALTTNAVKGKGLKAES